MAVRDDHCYECNEPLEGAERGMCDHCARAEARREEQADYEGDDD